MIEVPEHGEKTCELAPLDVEHIEAVAAGAAGVVFPERERRKAPLIKVSYTKDRRVTISAGGVVGIIPLPSGEVLHITPKVGSRHGVFWLLCHALGFGDIKLLSRLSEVETREDPLEWLFIILRHEVRKLVQAGLRKDYVPVEETAGVVRGRILPARTIAETRGLAHQVTCLYDDFTADIFDNQILRLALRAGASASPDLRHALLGTDALFDGEVTHERADLRRAADDLKRLLNQQHPARKRYVPAQTLAYMVLRLLSAGGDGRAWRQPGILLNMAALFEMALRNILGGASNRYRADFASPDGRHLVGKGMETDASLSDLIVDAKYYKEPLQVDQRYGGKLAPRNFFQAHTYSFFGRKPCALVYAVGSHTEHADVLANGLHQQGAANWPRVGLFCLNIYADGPEPFRVLDRNKQSLVDQVKDFARA